MTEWTLINAQGKQYFIGTLRCWQCW